MKAPIPVLGSLLIYSLAYSGNTDTSAAILPTSVTILWNESAASADSVDQLSFESALGCLGMTPTRLPLHQLSQAISKLEGLLVVPHSSAKTLDARTATGILARVRGGVALITDGPSRLARAAGFTFGAPILVTRIRERLRPDVDVRWRRGAKDRWLSGPLPSGAIVMASERAQNRPLAALLHLSKGRCLVFAPLFDPATGEGYDRFVSFPLLVVSVLKIQPPFSRSELDAYFDPAFRSRTTLRSLVAAWRRHGIRRVHAAAWDVYSDPPYDYARLIREAHRNGILVFAWLEWPYVGMKFWDDHPAWRQKNALLQDARLDFLRLMDFQNDTCLAAAFRGLDSLLTLDWDGIDLAEFSITGGVAEALQGPSQPENFVGFSEAARKGFRASHGFDQLELFNSTSRHFWKRDSADLNAFYRYRVAVNNSLLNMIVRHLDSLNRAGGNQRELVLTVLDNSLHPEFDQLLGFDRTAIVNLVRDFGLTLQVEDPLSEWSGSPDRYVHLGKTYRRLVGTTPFGIDINVVDVPARDSIDVPTRKPTGTELMRLVHGAARQTERVCFYSEYTVDGADWATLLYACAAGARAVPSGDGTTVETPASVRFHPAGNVKGVTLDERIWPCWSSQGILVPPGSHRISSPSAHGQKQTHGSAPRIVDCSADLTGAWVSGDTTYMEYSSPTRCLIAADRSVAALMLDGEDSSILPAYFGKYVAAPAGHHTLALVYR